MSSLQVVKSSTPAKRTRVCSVVALLCLVTLGTACGSSGSNKSSSTKTPTSTHTAHSTPGLKLHKRAGKVTAIGNNTITVATKRLGALQLHTTSATKIERAVAGSTSDITVGHRVLVPSRGVVIVLPPDSTIGRLVTNRTSGSFSIAKATGKGVTKISFLKVKDAETVSVAQLSAIKTGSEVLAVVRRASKGVSDAIEVILLPANSALAK